MEPAIGGEDDISDITNTMRRSFHVCCLSARPGPSLSRQA
jgi:hypothetical protein